MRGPHDDEIEVDHPAKDHARERLDDFLKRRDPSFKPQQEESHTGGEPTATPDPKLDPEPDPK